MKVTELGLTPKTAAILQDNGIATIDDLLLLDDASIKNMEELSYHRAVRVQECKRKWQAILEDDLVDDKEQTSKLLYSATLSDEYKTISSYLKHQKDCERNLLVFTFYYGNPECSLGKAATEFDISRERVRQLCKRYLNDIRKGFNSREIDPSLLKAIESAAETKTEISMIDVSDELLSRGGIVRAIVDAFPERFEIIKNRKINGAWLVNKDENVNNMIDFLSKTLQERESPMKIEDVLTIFPINEEMLLSIKNVVEKDGYVTLSTNRMVVGRIPRIKDYLTSIGRPASVQEISDGTGLTLNQVRGAISNKNFFESLGGSIYDSVDANYLDYSPSDLARNLLIAEGCAVSIPRVVKYVLRYDYSGRNERDVLIELFASNDSGVYDLDGCVLLKEWGQDKIKKPIRRNYVVELKDAVKDVSLELDSVFNAEMILDEIKQKYGDSTSNNLNSVKSYLNVLAKNGVLVEIGKNTGCYRRLQEGEMV